MEAGLVCKGRDGVTYTGAFRPSSCTSYGSDDTETISYMFDSTCTRAYKAHQRWKNFLAENARYAQEGNPAIGIANGATKDGHLTLGEANEIGRANNDLSFEVTVDASKLTVLQTSEFNKNGIASGRIPYSEIRDCLVHSSVTLFGDAKCCSVK